MSDWRPAKCLVELEKEVNAAHPHRPTGADGMIGDAAHQAEVSDHNPNAAGVVTAWDITTADFTDALAEKFRLMGAAGDRRIKYVIYKNRFTSALHGWKWVDYQTVRPGGDPHTSHIHLSVSADPAQYDRTDPWLNVKGSGVVSPIPVALGAEEDIMASLDDLRAVVKEELAKVFAALHNDHKVIIHGDTDHRNSLDSIGKQTGVPQS